ncbi:MAG: hypothetical protein AAF518_11405 [Spirochaetota bacterium]
MNKTLLYVSLAALIVILGVAYFYIPSMDESNQSGNKTGQKGQQDYMNSKEDPTMEPLDGSKLKAVSFDAENALEYYKNWAKYPPYSRPLHQGQRDLIDPFNGEKPKVGIVNERAKGCKKNSEGKTECDKNAVMSELACKMTPQQTISVGKGDFKVELYCFNNKGQNLKISQIVPKVYTIALKESTPSLPPISFGDNGKDGDKKANDFIYTFVVRPGGNDWGDMFLEVNMQVDGKEHVQRTSWFSTPNIVAAFAEGVSEQMDNGNLVVKVPINIQKAGFYQFDANLQGAGEDQAFVATSSWEGKLGVGSQTIDLIFWGKIIRDSNVSGPYLVREIRGRRNNSPVTPDMVKQSMQEGTGIPQTTQTEPLWEYIKAAPNFKTGSYSAADFGNKVWDSQEKQRRIKFLETVANQ